MIAYIQGTLEHITENSVILDNNGMGYEISVSPRTISRLPPQGGTIRLYTFTHALENAISLFGFISMEELRMFHQLLGVTGIGPKIALGILSAMEPERIALAIVSEDFDSLSQCPGVGKKSAQRLVLELKDKLKNDAAFSGAASAVNPQQTLSFYTGEKQDAIDALAALGYNRSESARAVLEVGADGLSTERILKLALRKLASR